MTTFRERIGLHQFETLVSTVIDDLFDINNYKIIKRLNSSHNPLSINPVIIVADPFLFVHNEELYLFFEEQKGITGKGKIKMTKTGDLKKWEKPVVVLEEKFHLSFPNVFEMNEQIFMMPETGEDNSIRLYTPNNDFTQWTSFSKPLLTGNHFVDSSIIFHDDYYFLFTTDYTNNKNVLRLYYSENLYRGWIEHPLSPVASGENTGRCGGAIFNYNGYLYRPSQLTQRRYGEGLDLYQIITLSKESYREEIVKNFIPNTNKYYRYGGHHFNYCKFKNQIIVATDVIEIKLNCFEIAKRLLIKMSL